jgi:plastocyanin
MTRCGIAEILPCKLRLHPRRCAASTIGLVLALASIAAHANVAIVIVGGNSLAFSPQTTDINVGDTVTFLNFGGLHNVVADDGSFRCAHGCDNDGHGGSGAPSSQRWQVSVTFPNAGTVGYFCETHGMPGSGMFGTINVAAAAPQPVAPDAIPLGGRGMLALLAAALIACAAPLLRRTRRLRKHD